MLVQIAGQVHLHFASREEPNSVLLGKPVLITRHGNWLEGKARRCLKNDRAAACRCYIIAIGLDNEIPAMVPRESAVITAV